jgi:hypothetical protein
VDGGIKIDGIEIIISWKMNKPPYRKSLGCLKAERAPRAANPPPPPSCLRPWKRVEIEENKKGNKKSVCERERSNRETTECCRKLNCANALTGLKVACECATQFQWVCRKWAMLSEFPSPHPPRIFYSARGSVTWSCLPINFMFRAVSVWARPLQSLLRKYRLIASCMSLIWKS